MLYVMVGSLIFGVFGIAYAVKMYYELWKWARQCQYARIVIAYKGKVRLNAPIQEWMLWTNLLDKDKDSNGRMIYTMGGTSVAIVKRSFVAEGPLREFAAWLFSRRRKVATPPASGETGKWTAKDQTVRDGTS